MKNYILALILVVLIISCTQKTEVVEQKATITPQEEKTNSIIEAPSSLDEKFAYVYGYQLLNSIMLTMPELKKYYFLEGVRAYVDNDFTFTMQESQAIMSEYQEKKYELYEAEMKEIRERNLSAAESFLATNKKRSGVISVSDKLQYEILRSPSENGAKATNKSTVTVDYRLVTLAGEVKDSSYERGQAAVFDLSTNIIEGFRSAVAQMQEGEKIRAWVHPDLGYGINGTSNIEPNQLLIFDIELISVDK